MRIANKRVLYKDKGVRFGSVGPIALVQQGLNAMDELYSMPGQEACCGMLAVWDADTAIIQGVYYGIGFSYFPIFPCNWSRHW